MVEPELTLVEICSTHGTHKQRGVQEWRHTTPSDTAVLWLRCIFHTYSLWPLPCNHIKYKRRARVFLPHGKANTPQAYEEELVTLVVLSYIVGEYSMAQVSEEKSLPMNHSGLKLPLGHSCGSLRGLAWVTRAQNLRILLWNKTSWALLVSQVLS